MSAVRWFSARRKAIVAAGAAALTWAGSCWVPDGHVDRGEWYLLALAVAGVLGVHSVTNDPQPERDSEHTDEPPPPGEAPGLY